MHTADSEYIGGVPTKVLTDLGKGENLIGRLSQRSLGYINAERSITIYDKDNRDIHFEIEITADGLIRIDAYTKDAQGKHKDLYARKLIEKSLEIFEKRGIQTKGVIAQWYLKGKLAGDNGREFLANLRNGMTESEAAKNTWTGRLAWDLNFPTVESVTYEFDDLDKLHFVEVKFVS